MRFIILINHNKDGESSKKQRKDIKAKKSVLLKLNISTFHINSSENRLTSHADG